LIKFTSCPHRVPTSSEFSVEESETPKTYMSGASTGLLIDLQGSSPSASNYFLNGFSALRNSSGLRVTP
jgi:hypothetical protein